MFMRCFGAYMTKADSVGKLILPKGDTLRSVMRLHTERYVSAVYADKDTLRKKVPTFTVDSIVRHMAADSLMVREDLYRWYAAGYRYPILEAKVTTLKDKPMIVVGTVPWVPNCLNTLVNGPLPNCSNMHCLPKSSFRYY